VPEVSRRSGSVPSALSADDWLVVRSRRRRTNWISSVLVVVAFLAGWGAWSLWPRANPNAQENAQITAWAACTQIWYGLKGQSTPRNALPSSVSALRVSMPFQSFGTAYQHYFYLLDEAGSVVGRRSPEWLRQLKIGQHPGWSLAGERGFWRAVSAEQRDENDACASLLSMFNRVRSSAQWPTWLTRDVASWRHSEFFTSG
jgi:hypothetical protein